MLSAPFACCLTAPYAVLYGIGIITLIRISENTFCETSEILSGVIAQEILISMSANCDSSEKHSMKTFDVDPPPVGLLYYWDSDEKSIV